MATTRLLSAMVATWNNVATTFTGLKLNVTDTASAAGSLLMDLQVGGVSKFSVSKAGSGTFAGGITGAALTALTGGNIVGGNRIYVSSNLGTFLYSGSDGTLGIYNAAATNSVDLTVGASNLLTLNGGLTTGGSVAVPGASGYFFSGVGSLTMPVSGGLQINDASATNTVRMTAGASNLLTLNGGLKTTGATFALQTATTLTDNAAAQVATMTNGPAAGNPTKWIAINDNGVTRYIPAW